ncbi:aromatic amino acid hydroxylase [Chlamydia pneumoniae]|nr:aromatic amino acid hydroxylase [Chlamydia pneumoniae]
MHYCERTLDPKYILKIALKLRQSLSLFFQNSQSLQRAYSTPYSYYRIILQKENKEKQALARHKCISILEFFKNLLFVHLLSLSKNQREGCSTDMAVVSTPFFNQNLWYRLLSSRFSLWKSYCPRFFLDYLEAFGLLSDFLDHQAVIKFFELETHFSYYPVSGFVAPHQYLSLLQDRYFPIASVMRTLDKDNFSLTPDLIHDLLGHVPWLLHPSFSEFFINMGRLFTKVIEKVQALPSKKQRIQTLQSNLIAIIRCFWFTVESGLIENHEGRKAYGAVLISSPQELRHAFIDNVRVLPLELDQIIRLPFNTSTPQETLFSIRHFDELVELTSKLEWMLDQGLLESIPLYNQEKYLSGFEVLCQ